jgi:hypothetical protein
MWRSRSISVSLPSSLVLGAVLAIAAPFALAASNTPAAAAEHQPRGQAGRATLENRVDYLSKALDLDAQQRARLLVILEAQRAAVMKIWSDPALLPAERAPATRAVEERTADRIRAILSDKQKERYNPPKSQSTKSSTPDVGKWMDLTRNSNQGAVK